MGGVRYFLAALMTLATLAVMFLLGAIVERGKTRLAVLGGPCVVDGLGLERSESGDLLVCVDGEWQVLLTYSPRRAEQQAKTKQEALLKPSTPTK